MRRTRRAVLAMVAWVLGAPGGARADEFPSRYIKVIVGPGLDAPARIFGAKAAEILGQQVVVEPRPGAGGAIAAQAVTGAAPDGYIPCCSRPPPIRSTRRCSKPRSICGAILRRSRW